MWLVGFAGPGTHGAGTRSRFDGGREHGSTGAVYYGRARAAADRAIGEVDLEATGTSWSGNRVSMRWVLIHMVEETARHAGHADIVRELIDGATGDHRPD
jgi:hypothetical protein